MTPSEIKTAQNLLGKRKQLKGVKNIRTRIAFGADDVVSSKAITAAVPLFEADIKEQVETIEAQLLEMGVTDFDANKTPPNKSNPRRRTPSVAALRAMSGADGGGGRER